MRIESNDVLAKSIFSSQSLTGRMISTSAFEPVGREFYSVLCSYSVFAVICNEFDAASLLQLRPMVTSKLALTCFKLVASLHSCYAKLVSSSHSCHDKFVASLLKTKIAIWDGEPSFSYLKSTLIEPHSTQETTNSSQDMGRS
ncbi:hypothetical protein AVEN_25189-1 [Araneus ventricosus]|uniref:Uncharacterized protein n=1 Tax=Araneus ventricosus TaxID=182803 RepID=A0A4Y2RSZ8_ARAVE|nr:hypothetical protein AVEN_25189-1 [Araneus ventricosus]